MKRFVKVNKDYKELEPIVVAFKEYKNLLSNIEEAREILKNEKDDDMREMAQEELEASEQRRDIIEEEIRLMLIPKDPTDDKNAVMEIRAGSGGDEASIFAGDLYRMYIRYCETKGWKIELVEMNEGTAGGFKEVVFNVIGDGAYGLLKFESGVHRVQRVPKTETQGRIHTSAASVVVLPEAEEFDVELNEKDIRKETFCASGPGGQSVNTTYSAVRLTHIPSGIVVSCQDEKSQIKNLATAMKVLRTRLYEREDNKYLESIASQRKTMVSTGDRSAKIRTYNYPQGRVTDHRINLTIYNLQSIIDGDINEIIEKLQMAENAERLKEN
jgi:peptide chain release factor 1